MINNVQNLQIFFLYTSQITIRINIYSKAVAPLVVVLVVLENHSILTAGVKWNHSNLTILVKEEVKNILRTTRLKILMEPLLDGEDRRLIISFQSFSKVEMNSSYLGNS